MKKKIALEAYLGVFIVISSLIICVYTGNAINKIEKQASLNAHNPQTAIAQVQ
jgi:hypothetical protein